MIPAYLDFPVPTRNHRPVALVFLRLTPAGPALTPSGRPSVEFGWTQANDFRRNGPADEDTEVTRFSASGRWRIGPRDEVFAEAALLARGSGFLDRIIDGWHQQVLGWSDPERNRTAIGRNVVAREGAYRYGSAFGLADTTVGLRRSLGPDTAVRVAVELPTGNRGQLLGSGGLDVGAGIDHRWRLGRAWSLHAGGSAVRQGGSGSLGGRAWVFGGGLSLVYAPNRSSAWIAQWSSEDSPTRTGVPGVDAAHRLITFAYRMRLRNGATLDLYFSEDRDLFSGKFPEGANIGPDFTIGVRYRF